MVCKDAQLGDKTIGFFEISIEVRITVTYKGGRGL